MIFYAKSVTNVLCICTDKSAVMKCNKFGQYYNFKILPNTLHDVGILSDFQSIDFDRISTEPKIVRYLMQYLFNSLYISISIN
jgi:hypothetical protein